MNWKHSIRRAAAAACCALLLLTLALPAGAAEGTISCTYIPITGEEFVAETMNGVEARYNLYGSTYQCVELVIRYYQEVYGLEIRCAQGNLTVLNNDDLYFVETDDPQPGDVLFGSAAARGKGYDHWALVRSNNGDSLTLFEQNWRWNGQAGIGRVIEFPTTSYRAFTLASRSGAEIVPADGSPAAVSDWAAPYLEAAAEAGIAALETDFQSAVTREAFCAMALNVLAARGVEPASDGTACEQAASLGLVDGSADGAAALTRQEAAVITARLMDLLGQEAAADTAALAVYADAGEVAAWAAEAVAQVTACGLMSGSDGCFNPRESMTNEAAVALLVRVHENPTPALLMAADGADEAADARPTAAAARTAAPALCAALDVVMLGAGDMMLSRGLFR